MNTIFAIIAALALPTAEVETAFHNRQVKFGAVEHDGGIGAVEGEIAWYGLSFDAEWIYDQHGGRELTLGPGYSHTFAGLINAGFKYLYEGHPERIEEPTQFVVPTLSFDCLLHPSIEWWLDADRNRGASYWSADCGHGFDLPLHTRLELDAGIGIGNARRNAADADHDSFGIKDIHARAALEIPLCEHCAVVPYVGCVHRFYHHDEGCACILCTGCALAMTY